MTALEIPRAGGKLRPKDRHAQNPPEGIPWPRRSSAVSSLRASPQRPAVGLAAAAAPAVAQPAPRRRPSDPAGAGRRPLAVRSAAADHRQDRLRLHGRRAEVASASTTSRPAPARPSARSMNRSSPTATTRSPNSSPRCTRTPRPRCATAMRRSRRSRWRAWCTARSACSTPRWRSTTPLPTACRC